MIEIIGALLENVAPFKANVGTLIENMDTFKANGVMFQENGGTLIEFKPSFMEHQISITIDRLRSSA